MELFDAIRAFIRLEVSTGALSEALRDFEGEIAFAVPIEDWLTLYRKMSNSEMPIEQFRKEFLECYTYSFTEDYTINIYGEPQSAIEKLRSGRFFVGAMDYLLCEELWNKKYCGRILKEVMDEMLDVNEAYNCYMLNVGKPSNAHVYPKSAKRIYIMKLKNELKGKNDEEIALYRSFVDELCQYNEICALECKGYGCYGGDEAYECDWVVSRDCMLRLMELEPIINDRKAAYANTLGYIHYYGRCNDGVPEYDKAFKMYSIGAAGGVIESVYKLADMYIEGKGVPKNEKAGENIISWAFDRHYKDFLMGRGDKMADLALRKGIVCGNRYHMAMRYLLMADYAIRMRLPMNEYGDDKVFRSIQEKIENIRGMRPYFAGRNSISGTRPNAINKVFKNDYIAKITFKEYSKSLKITATRRKKQSQFEPEMIEVCFPEYGFYNLQDSVVENASGNIEYKTVSGDTEFFADSIRYDSAKNALEFLLFDKIVATIKADKYTFKFPTINYENE